MSTTDMLSSIKASPTCNYCGRELKTTKVVVGGREYGGLPCYGTCGCEESRRAMDGRQGETMADAIRRKCRDAGIGEAYLDSKADCGKMVEAVMAGRTLWISGAIGSGKTTIASAVSRELVAKDKSVRFETMVGILRKMRESFGKGLDALDGMFGCDVLVLDDLGKESPTDLALYVLFELVDYRYSNSRPFIITTNYDGGELAGRLAVNGEESTAEAIVSRLMHNCAKMTTGGRNWRID